MSTSSIPQVIWDAWPVADVDKAVRYNVRRLITYSKQDLGIRGKIKLVLDKGPCSHEGQLVGADWTAQTNGRGEVEHILTLYNYTHSGRQGYRFSPKGILHECVHAKQFEAFVIAHNARTEGHTGAFEAYRQLQDEEYELAWADRPC